MSAIMKSISPKECERIVSGEQTVLVSKTRPKIDTPFKCYIYCTKGENLWLAQKGVKSKTELTGYLMNGKVIGEFVCNRIDEWKYLPDGFVEEENEKMYYINSAEGDATCLTYDEIENYGKGKTLYGWHISDLKIYDKPIELGKFDAPCPIENHNCEHCLRYGKPYTWAFNDDTGKIYCTRKLTRPPQSWCYVEELKGGKK